MTKPQWESLQVSRINYTVSADAMQEMVDLRANEKRRAWMTGPDGKMLINLSPISEATSNSVGLESVSKRAATFGVPATHLAGHAPPVAPEPARVWVHDIDDMQGHIERHHQHMARLDELARLQAREEHAARSQPNAAPVLRLVSVQPQPAPPVEHRRQSADRARKPSWRDAVTPYIVAKLRVWRCATAKDLFAALEKEAGTPESPFDTGTGAHRGKLFVRAFSQPVDLKTIRNAWGDLRRDAGISV
ncbi:hypothetical protein [Paucibacter sp. M5-1]|uniref:hypothetical protein n=1 Tax=Paucibacter sp. M5-1 TaxID=3015998 RepID=UPI0022B8A115|nr:hypothetical protein [Paucibacter sp. M5-1]MCZ7883793.1 hypothetical protein [Paucibacter sp. M5-1]